MDGNTHYTSRPLLAVTTVGAVCGDVFVNEQLVSGYGLCACAFACGCVRVTIEWQRVTCYKNTSDYICRF